MSLGPLVSDLFRPGSHTLVGVIVVLVAALAIGMGSVGAPVPGDAHTTVDGRLMAMTVWPLKVVPWRDLPQNGERILGDRTRKPADADGVPLMRWGDGELVYNPTVLALYGMRRLDSWQRTGRDLHLRLAVAVAQRLDRDAIVARGMRWQPHWYDHPGQDMKAPWVNGNSHGLALSFFSRFYRLTGEERYRVAAERLFNAYRAQDHGPDGLWFATLDESFQLWFEHYPVGRQARVLNAHLNAAFGLYDYLLISGDALAADYLRAALTTAHKRFEQFRRPGHLSAYSLDSPHFSLGYHRTHIGQLRLAGRITADGSFAHMAELLRRDQTAWAAVIRGAGPIASR